MLTNGKDKVVAGVCSGIAEKLDIDPKWVRIGWGVTSLFYGIGIFAYIGCALLMPDKE